MVFMRFGIKNHPYFDDVDEYYLGLSQETEYEKETSTTKEKESVKTNSLEKEHLKTKISSSTHQFVNPLRVFVPKRKRGSGKLGFTSKETQSKDQEAKSTSSVDEFGNPPEIIAVQTERRATTDKFVKKTNYCITTDQEDDQRSKIKRQEKKTCAGKKRMLKRQKIGKDREKSTKKGKQMGTMVDFKKLGLHPPPNFSSLIKSSIDYQEGRDSEIKLRIMKQIFKTDMDKHQDRFSMPLNQIDVHQDGEEFLKKVEMEEMCRWKSKGIEVKMVEMGIKDDNYVHESTMRLRRWEMNSSSSYMLNSSWHAVLDRNEGALKLNDIVQVYSFRRDDKLWLVLLKVMDADHQVGNGKGIKNEVDGVRGVQTVQVVDASTGCGRQDNVP